MLSRSTRMVTLAILAALPAAAARAQDAGAGLASPRLELSYHGTAASRALMAPDTGGASDPALGPATGEPASSALASSSASSSAPFGTAQQEWWTIGLGYATDFDRARDWNIRGSYSRFLVADVEFFAELGAWYFDQEGDNAWGINPAFGLRWHFLNRDRWTLFADVGIGLLLSTDNVPQDSTSANFTPRAGVGATWQWSVSSPSRLQVGLRWHHVSNARIAGDVRNQSRDGAMLYVGLMLPF